MPTNKFPEAKRQLTDGARRKRRPSSFNLDARRRREIERHAKHIGAAETEDFERWLIAWAWHNGQTTDPKAALQEAAPRMGGKLSEREAEHILKRAKTIRRRRNADSLGKWLGLNYGDREKLKITSIGSKDIGKQARKELRKRANRIYLERRRRAQGIKPRAEYQGNSLSRTKPWKAEGISRRTWERHRNKTRDASPKAALSLSHNNDASPKAAILSTAYVGPASAGTTVVSSSSPSTPCPSSSRRATLPAADTPLFRLFHRHPRDRVCGELESPMAVVTVREVWPPLGPVGDDVFDLVAI
jgi:hypothetical protein